MIGLEFVCQHFKMDQKELAEKLQITPTNISSWFKRTREIPTKYLVELSKILKGLPPEYFQRELSGIDELKIKIYYIEHLDYEQRTEEFTVSAVDDPTKLIVDERYDCYEDELTHLRMELNKAIKVSSYYDRIQTLFDKLEALDKKERLGLFKERIPEDFILSKLNNYLDFLSTFQAKSISTLDTIIEYFRNYAEIEREDWGTQELFPNERLLAFYKDIDGVFAKHNLK